MKPGNRCGLAPVLALLAGCAAAPDERAPLRLEIAGLRAQLQEAREQARANTLACSALAQQRDKALLSARQLRADTQYLRSSTQKLSDAVTRLSYEDWDKVVPEVQLHFSDVESASNDLDARVGRVLIALHADTIE